MRQPHRIFEQTRRLLPPAVFLQEIVSSVAVHIADAQSVREALITRADVRDAMELPRLARVDRISRGISEGAVVDANELPAAAGYERGVCRRFVVDVIEHEMLWPGGIFIARVL